MAVGQGKSDLIKGSRSKDPNLVLCNNAELVNPSKATTIYPKYLYIIDNKLYDRT